MTGPARTGFGIALTTGPHSPVYVFGYRLDAMSNQLLATDCARWALRRFWSWEQAALLLAGIIPDAFEGTSGGYEFPLPGVPEGVLYPDEVGSWLRLIDAAAKRDGLEAKNSPKKWLEWGDACCPDSIPPLLKKAVLTRLSVGKDERPVGKRERETALKIIVALAALAKLRVDQPSATALAVAAAAVEAHVPVAARTIENYLNDASRLIVR